MIIKCGTQILKTFKMIQDPGSIFHAQHIIARSIWILGVQEQPLTRGHHAKKHDTHISSVGSPQTCCEWQSYCCGVPDLSFRKYHKMT